MNLSCDWFSPKERVLMTSLFNVGVFSGTIVGFLLPNIWIDPNETDMEIAR